MGRRDFDNTDAAAQEADDAWSERDLADAPVSPRYEIFGGIGCDYCIKAKDLLDRLELDYTYIDLTVDEEGFDQLVGRLGRWKTVPQIFSGATHIGGYDDLVRHLAAPAEPTMTMLEPLASPAFTFVQDSTWVMRITEGGKLEFNPEVTQDEAGRSVIKVLMDFWLDARGMARHEELLEANTRYLLRARKSEDYLKLLVANVEPLNEKDERMIKEIEAYLIEPWRYSA